MATKSVTIKTVTCDLCQEEGAEKVPFSIGDESWSIDLCDDHRKQFAESMSGWTAVAKSRRRQTSGNGSNRAASSLVDSIAVRTWARENGFEVSEKGRLSNEVLDAYQAAHQEPQSTS